MEVGAVLTGRLQDRDDHWLAFTFKHRVDAAVSMLQNLGRRERGTVATDHDQGFGKRVRVAFARSMISGRLAK